MSDETFNTPDEADVLQLDDDDIKAVAVKVENVVRVDEMPTRLGGMSTTEVGVTGGKIANGDATRKTLTLISRQQDIYLGHTQGDVNQNSGGCWWPVNTPFVTTSSDEIWASAVTDRTTISVITEQWAN